MGKHAEWRKLAKKLRRKRIRTMIAVARDNKLLLEQQKRDNSPTYKAWLKEQQVLEDFKEAEEKRLAMQRQAAWQAEEETAMLRWREQQSRIAQAKAEKIKKEIMMREEWEREQRKLEEAEEVRKKVEDEKKRKQEELMGQIDAFIEGKADFPDEANVPKQTHPGHPDCPFFSKTGACRFRDSCSRNHTKPGISRTLIIPNFYDLGLKSLHQEEYDTDLSLEYEDSETYQHFKEFYKDVLPEFERCGRVIQFRICTNEEPHLRGNVYVEFQSRRHALKAYRTFQGRFYAGRRLNVEFTNIPSWRNAICGLYHKRMCPKGKTCNFLHVFRNPNNAFKIYNSSSRRQFSKSRSRSPLITSRNKDNEKEWNWSEGEGSGDETKRRRSRSNSKSKLVSKKYDSGSEEDRKSMSTSPRRSKQRDRSREQRKKRDRRQKSRSRSPHSSGKRYRDSNRGDFDDKSRKDKYGDRKSEKETNGKQESSKLSSKEKDKEWVKKKSDKEKYGKESSTKIHNKDKTDENNREKTKLHNAYRSSSNRKDTVEKKSSKRAANGNL